MRLGLIAMSGLRVRSEELAAMGVILPQFVTRGQVIASLPSLGLLTVAALTPKDVEISYIEIDRLPPDHELEPFDLVGISSSRRELTLRIPWPIATVRWAFLSCWEDCTFH